ncbi:MAG: iron-sulfur cluster insertion protein ErpA [Patescibacteria group bacterium]
MIKLTERAATKVLEILSRQDPKPLGLRIAIRGGGCSGFQYAMEFAEGTTERDKIFEFGELTVFVDQTSLMYLEGTEIDYVDGLEGAGFKFTNPNVKNTCGCGSSFSQ